MRYAGAGYALNCDNGRVLLQLSLDERSPARINSFVIRDEPDASPCG